VDVGVISEAITERASHSFLALGMVQLPSYLSHKANVLCDFAEQEDRWLGHCSGVRYVATNKETAGFLSINNSPQLLIMSVRQLAEIGMVYHI